MGIIKMMVVTFTDLSYVDVEIEMKSTKCTLLLQIIAVAGRTRNGDKNKNKCSIIDEGKSDRRCNLEVIENEEEDYVCSIRSIFIRSRLCCHDITTYKFK